MLTAPAVPGFVPLDGIDLYPGELYASGDPHAAWRTLRAKAPLWRQQAPDGTPFWSVTRYRDVSAVLEDPRRFSSEHSTMLTVLDADPARGRAIHLTDPPRHDDVRTATVRAVSMRVMRRHGERITERVRALVDGAGEEFDFTAVAEALPMAVAGELLGVPEDQWAEASRWAVASMAPTDPRFQAGSAEETLRQAHVYLFTLFCDLIAERREEPGDDLVSALVAASRDGAPLGDDDVLVNCYAFIMGANPTIPQASSHFMLAAAEAPSVWARLRAEPALLSTAVEEALRWASPVNHVLRRTAEPVELCGTALPEGSLVAAWLGSANRDEEVFTDPYAFDIARRPNPHIAFGDGVHRCAGLAPARVGLQTLLQVLLERYEGWELTGEVDHLDSNFLNGITRLPLAVRRSRR
ncbi:cytochrome P450 [Allonocardiopsis opalescens]|uniref:Cytochrome P450 n=1 Tax=Allonocardiopsis opalescens TaxID=1144618 RepID=A0A2T0PY95_9ACTN|nr:cytochrome P450 [Allonocardiopsis opalescens]PRX96511.1 cytochrome P450 [Allonocardiopsis opalescens]